MDSSSDDSGEEGIDDDDEEETHETGTVASNCSRGNSSRQRRPCSVVWKFFSALQGRKSVQCQLEIMMVYLHITEGHHRCVNI